MSPSSFPAERILREQHRWIRYAPPLCVAACGLALALVIGWFLHPSFARIEKWGVLAPAWGGGVVLTILAVLGIWLFRRRGLLRSAQQLDERLSAKNRVEAATMLRDRSDAISEAQRQETERFLGQTRDSRRGVPLAVMSALVALLAVANLVMLAMWTRPWVSGPIHKPVAAEATPTLPPTASIKWKSPEAETKAGPIEEIPLEALAESSSGLRDITLEIAVNGLPKSSVPVSVADIEKAGTHKVLTSIYLDQLDVQPYDMVSYYLRARRISDRKDLPETASGIQFVQVKPLRDDIREAVGPAGIAREMLNLLTALKVAQLRLIRENFALLHADIPHDSSEWQKENKRVGGEQTVLESKSGEIIQKLITDGAPAEIVNLLEQARPLIGDAARKIAAEQNQQACPTQGKALGLITEAEKFSIKEIIKSQGIIKPGPNVRDPFEKQRKVELKQRFKTKAGDLELLVREQRRLAEDIAGSAPAMPAPDAAPQPDDHSRIAGTAPERETQVSQRIGALLNGNVFGPEITAHLENAHGQALESLRHLDSQDAAGAAEPSAATARELKLAMDAMLRAAEQQAKDQMESALRDVNKAADEAKSAPDQQTDQKAAEKAQQAAQKTAQARNDLAQAAQQQQETGSEAAAKRMAELANALGDPKLLAQLEKLKEEARNREAADATAKSLRDLAQNAARQMTGGKSSEKEDLARLVERMKRIDANLSRLANNGSARSELQNANGSPNAQDASPRNGKGEKSSPGGNRETSEPQKSGDTGQDSEGEGQKSKGEAQTPRGMAQGSEGKGQSPEGDSQKPGDAGQGSEAKGQSPGGTAQGSEGNGTGSEGKGQGSESQAENSGGTGEGGAGSQRTTAPPESQREQFARDLLEDLREATDESYRYLPDSKRQLDALRESVQRAIQYNEKPGNGAAPLYGSVEKPLNDVIGLLLAASQATERQFQLSDQSAEKAPAAYQAAVDDYFERLSRDYERKKGKQ